jgi:hypothetical protein
MKPESRACDKIKHRIHSRILGRSTDYPKGVAVGGAFDSDTATGIMPDAQRVAGVLTSWRS